MPGTAADRSEELARINRSESNTYESGRSGSASTYNKGFTKDRRAKDPNKASEGTAPPNGRG